jgi:hypothetical protein
MPAFDDLFTALREDSDQAILEPAATLRAIGRQRSVRRRGIVAAVVVLLAGGTAVGLTEAHTDSPLPVAGRPAVSQFTYVSGRVTVDGRPFAGATIELTFDLNTDAMSRILPGQEVPVYVPPLARTNQDGYYEIVIGPNQIPAQYRDGDGASVFDTHIKAGDRMGLWGGGEGPCVPPGAQHWCGDERSGPLIVDFEMGATQLVRDDTDGHGTWSGLSGP